jgi:hypothetical protein
MRTVSGIDLRNDVRLANPRSRYGISLPKTPWDQQWVTMDGNTVMAPVVETLTLDIKVLVAQPLEANAFGVWDDQRSDDALDLTQEVLVDHCHHR